MTHREHWWDWTTRTLAVAAVVVVAACAPLTTPATRTLPTWASTPAAGVVRSAADGLATLQVRGPAYATGYSRDLFGPAWADVTGSGCDTRNTILAAQMTNVTFRTGGCLVASGRLVDPYSGTTVAFVRGPQTSDLVEVDHVVALAQSFQSGAAAWDPVKRERFANDPLNLLAVTMRQNRAKGDASADKWVPPNTAYQCSYVARQVAVKLTYGLWVTPSEHDAIARILASCPNQPLPTGGLGAPGPSTPVASSAPRPR